MLRFESRKSLVLLVAALFVFNLFLGFHHQGSLANVDGRVDSLAVSAATEHDSDHSSGCRICQWTCAERTEVPRPLLVCEATSLAEAAPLSSPAPAAALLVSLLRSRAPPRLVA